MTSREQHSAHLSRRRLWGFRAGAVLLGLSPFVLLEIVCLIGDWGRVTNFDDPFVGFTEIHPLFVADNSGDRYEIPPSRLKFFAPESFSVEKSAGTFRIFCLGGSTVQGRPYSTPTAFSTWLRLSLFAADGSRNWEVINCGGVSYASYRLVPILEECLTHRPDLIVLCSGHNEFLEERTYAHIKHAPAVLSLPLRTLARLRSFTLLQSAVFSRSNSAAESPAKKKPLLKSEVDALLDYRNGIGVYRRDDDWRARVVAHYAHNLRRMLALADAAGVPVILIAPPSNLNDSPPFKSQHRGELTGEELAQWTELVEQARGHFRDDLGRAIVLLHQAIDIDGRFAATHYELGQCLAARGLRDDARAAFVRARDEDICPLRMLSSMEQILAEVAAETGTPLIDAHALLETESSAGILGGGQLVDHIHPNFRGHQLIADAIAAEMVDSGYVTPSEDWTRKRDAAFEQHLDSLDDLYHLRGQRTLGNLRAWAQGRADGPAIESKHDQ